MLDHKAQYKKILIDYIPEQAVDLIADWILHFNFNLKITENRASKLGDYRAPMKNSRHLITINHNLNKFSFLITLVHEIAHLTTFEKYKQSYRRVLPHGAEWKQEYKNLMRYFMRSEIFPEDVMRALHTYMSNPAASSCSDENLLRVLRNYDQRKTKFVHVEEISEGATFKYGKLGVFLKQEKIRKRYRCLELATKREYYFSPLAEVIPIEASTQSQ